MSPRLVRIAALGLALAALGGGGMLAHAGSNPGGNQPAIQQGPPSVTTQGNAASLTTDQSSATTDQGDVGTAIEDQVGQQVDNGPGQQVDQQGNFGGPDTSEPAALSEEHAASAEGDAATVNSASPDGDNVQLEQTGQN